MLLYLILVHIHSNLIAGECEAVYFCQLVRLTSMN